LALPACSDSETEAATKKNSENQRRWYRNGSLTGADGGFLMMGRGGDKAEGGQLGVNSFLWRASLDTLSFMPLASADPFGGVIITDWYEDPETPGERFKVNALILDKTLRADGVKVTLFKQKLEKGTWRDKPVDTALEKSLEDTILTRARQLKVTQLK
ncbi:MAG: DUF3576 domain-containing protein, partial [Proteobacteria bacterium]|nr:DUF3576 domain-containing protein [Pseudomonadota bacterium]